MKPLYLFVVTILLSLPLPLLAQESTSETSVKKLKVRSTKYSTFYSTMVRDFEGELVDSNYYMQPEELRVTTHSFGLGYNLNKNWAFALSNQYIINDITLQSPEVRQGPIVIAQAKTLEATTEGLSDTMIGAMYRSALSPSSSVTYSLHLSVPTGAYDKKTSKGHYVSYQGQLGSGTYDFVPQVEYRGRFNRWSVSGKALAKIRTGRNDLDYRLGDEVRVRGSVGYWFSKYAALTAGVYYKNWREVTGSENIDAHNRSIRPSGSSKSGKTGPARRAQAHRYGQAKRGSAPRGSAGGDVHRRNSNPFADYNLSDAFAASGARLSGQVGLRSGFYFGPILKGLLEVGVPVYHQEIGELEGLDAQWYAMTAIQSSF